MLILDLESKEVNIGDTVILRDEYRSYIALLVKETKKSVAYKVLETHNPHVQKQWLFHIRKNSQNFKCMYKI